MSYITNKYPWEKLLSPQLRREYYKNNPEKQKHLDKVIQERLKLKKEQEKHNEENNES